MSLLSTHCPRARSRNTYAPKLVLINIPVVIRHFKNFVLERDTLCPFYSKGTHCVPIERQLPQGIFNEYLCTEMNAN